MKQKNVNPKIAIVIYPDVQMSAVLGLCDLFIIANGCSQKYKGSLFNVEQVSKEMMLDAKADSNSQKYDVVILPPNLHRSQGKDEMAIHSWLRSQHNNGAVLSSVCVGAFWLGHSGLLNGRRATTHWAVAEEFQTTFPDTFINAELLLVDDDDIVTTGGLMAWLDLGLYIVNRWLGPQVVSDTARHLLIDPNGREQRSYRTFRPVLDHGDINIQRIQHWLEESVSAETTIAKMAQQASLSERTFLRRFKAATGYTPNNYIQQLRIEKSRGMLEHSRRPISEIAYKVGYQDTSAFSRVFRSITGLTAGEYRKRFGVQSRHSNSQK